MAFNSINFSPVGGNARGGNIAQSGIPAADRSENSLQVFTYASEDPLSEIIANNYFKELGGGRYIRRGDWIDIASDVDTSLIQSIHFVLGAGVFPSALTAVRNVNGSGYGAGDVLTVTYIDGTIEQKTTVRVVSVSGGVPQEVVIQDPGFFSVVPTTLTALATLGGGGDDLTVDLTLATQPSEGLVTLSSLAITAI